MRALGALTLLFIATVLDDTASADVLDPVIIDSPQQSTSEELVGNVEHEEFTGSYTHIDAEQLSQEPNSLAEIIAQESGIQMRQSGGAGTYSSISIRGATSAQTNIYFDGVLLNNASDGGVDLSQIELLNIGSLDIYRAATPVQLGVSNIGGAVNLQSPRTAKSEAKILVGVGSFDSQRLQLSFQQKNQIWDSSLAFVHRKSKNDFSLLNRNGTPLNQSDDVIEKRRNGQFERNAMLFKFGRQVGMEK